MQKKNVLHSLRTMLKNNVMFHSYIMCHLTHISAAANTEVHPSNIMLWSYTLDWPALEIRLPLICTDTNGEIRFLHISFIKKRHFTGIILIYIFYISLLIYMKMPEGDYWDIKNIVRTEKYNMYLEKCIHFVRIISDQNHAVTAHLSGSLS
jgi:hypothetical protein